MLHSYLLVCFYYTITQYRPITHLNNCNYPVKKDSFAAILYTNMLSQFFLSFLVPVCVELGVESMVITTCQLSR
jgi:hypothetical protein